MDVEKLAISAIRHPRSVVKILKRVSYYAALGYLVETDFKRLTDYFTRTAAQRQAISDPESSFYAFWNGVMMANLEFIKMKTEWKDRIARGDF